MLVKIVSWNVNGFRSAYKKGLPEFVQACGADIICLQEMRVDEATLASPSFALQDFHGFHCVADKKGYSGVSTYTRAGVEPLSVSRGIGREIFDREGRTIVLSFAQFDLYNIYYPSGTSGDHRQSFKYEFLEALYRHLKNLPPEKRRRIVMCGDFNICHREIDIHHPETATRLELTGFLPDERAWMDRFEALGFTDTFRQIHGSRPQCYTWWSFRANSRAKNLGWRIDYIWTSQALSKHIRDASIYADQAGSDHCPVSVDIQFDDR